MSSGSIWVTDSGETWDIELLCQGVEDRFLGGKAHVDQNISEESPSLPLPLEGPLQLFLGDHSILDKQGAERFIIQGIALCLTESAVVC
jgi:hypothetical protein